MKNKKLIYGIMLVSLAVNFFLAGSFFTYLTRDGDRPFGPPERFNIEAARDALEPEYQAVVEKIWGSIRKEQKAQFRKMFRLRSDLRDLLLAEEFDLATYDAKVEEMEAAGKIASDSVFDLLRQIAVALPVDERRKFFEVVFSRDNRSSRNGPPNDQPPPDEPPEG